MTFAIGAHQTCDWDRHLVPPKQRPAERGSAKKQSLFMQFIRVYSVYSHFNDFIFMNCVLVSLRLQLKRSSKVKELGLFNESLDDFFNFF